MNAPAPGSSRRRFLTRLFTDPDSNPAVSELRPLDELRQHTDGVLWAATIAGDNMYVAGDEGAVFRYDQEQWVREAFPSELPIHALCQREDRLFSVGWLGQICERLDGSWHAVQGGENASGRINLPLFDIEADDNGSLWAVGDQGRIVQFDGEHWLEHDSGTQANLRSVLPLPDGRVLAGGSGGTVLLLKNGTWSLLETGTGCPITSMASLGDDTVIAVGGEYDIDSGEFRGRLFLFSESKWQTMESEHPLPRLRRVRRFGDALLICGDDGTAFRWSADGASRMRCRLRYDLHDILCGADGRVLLCGDGGTLLEETAVSATDDKLEEFQQVQWRQISNGETNRTLRTLWPVGEGRLMAAGDSGALLHIEGSKVRVDSTPQGLRIHDLWGSSPTNIFAACDNATILHYDGSQWTLAHKGESDTALLAITGFGPHDIFAVGDDGHALRYDGLMWRQLETGVKQELYGLWGQDSRHLLAVGGGGLVLRFNGEHWKQFSAGTDHDLYGVCGSGLEKLFLAGLSGTLVRFEDNAWHKDYAGVRSDLHSVTKQGDTWYAAGSNGTLLRNRDGIWEIENTATDATLQAIEATGNGIYACGSGGLILRRRNS